MCCYRVENRAGPNGEVMLCSLLYGVVMCYDATSDIITDIRDHAPLRAATHQCSIGLHCLREIVLTFPIDIIEAAIARSKVAPLKLKVFSVSKSKSVSLSKNRYRDPIAISIPIVSFYINRDGFADSVVAPMKLPGCFCYNRLDCMSEIIVFVPGLIQNLALNHRPGGQLFL